MRVNNWMKEFRPLIRSFSAQTSEADKPEILGVSLFICWYRCTSEHLFIVPLISRDKWPDGEIPENKKNPVCSLVPKYGCTLAQCERGEN